MKNIHVLRTDKSSRLYIGDNGNFVFGFTQTSIQSRNDCFTNQYIYITSDEEIKEGDYFYSLFQGEERILKYNKFVIPFPEDRKIILTTDQDLIKDGVQAIEDEFLEWFVKNSSCEEVKVDLVPVNDFGSEVLVTSYGFDRFIYKIIIPKEESKQERLYTEKEVIEIVKKSRETGLTAEYLIEQFKKK